MSKDKKSDNEIVFDSASKLVKLIKCHMINHMSKEFLIELPGLWSRYGEQYFTDTMVMQFIVGLMGQEFNTIKYPANWKEALKDRWLPKLLRKRFPIHYKTVDIKVIYPNIKYPNEKHLIRMYEDYEYDRGERDI